MALTPKQNFLELVNGGSPEYTPWRISLSGEIVRHVARTYGDDFPERHGLNDIAHTSFWVRWPNVVYRKTEASTWIDGILIEDWPALDAYPWPDAADPAWYADLDRYIAAHGERHAVVCMFPSVFHSVDLFRGYDKFFLDVYDEPERVAILLERITRTLEVVVEHICRRPIDLLVIGDDIATQSSLLASPEFLDQYVHPYNQRLVEIAKRHGKLVFFHTDGVIPDVLTDTLMAMGFDGLHPMQYTCIDMHAWAAKYRDRLLTYGWLDNQHICAEGSLEDIRAHVADIFAALGNRFLCSSSDIMGLPPPENIIALPRIIRETCRFR